MLSSKQKHCITNWFKKMEKEQDKRIEEGSLPILPESEWYLIFLWSCQIIFTAMDHFNYESPWFFCV